MRRSGDAIGPVRAALRAGAASCALILGLAAPAAAQLNCNAGVEFYAGGGIARCNLNGEHRIYTAQGVAVRCADGKPLEQHPGGALKSCVIPQARAFGELRCDRDSRVDFGPDGRVLGCESPRG